MVNPKHFDMSLKHTCGRISWQNMRTPLWTNAEYLICPFITSHWHPPKKESRPSNYPFIWHTREQVTSGQIISNICITHISAQTELDLIHEDESIWPGGRLPVQHHTALHCFSPPQCHLAGDVICSNWETQTCLFLWDRFTIACAGVGPGRFLTCRFGPGVDEGSGAAVPHLLVACMEVNAVDSKGLQFINL